MKQTPADFLCKMGWSPQGQECLKQQIVIGTRAFCVIAAVTPNGFIAWQIFECNVTALEFGNFLTNCLGPVLMVDSILLLDNAASHHTDTVRTILHEISDGKYCYSPPYSPHFKPIEKCFALVNNHIRANETTALLNPVPFINATFGLFAVGGPRAGSILGHWAPYIRARNIFLNS